MPHFTLEVQGETNPLTLQEVLSTLSKAYGGGGIGAQQSLQVATEQLSNWEKQSGYYSILQDVYADLSIAQNLRFQAIIQLKNGVDKHWRKTSVSAISKEEKSRIRARAIASGIEEPVPALALQNALMIAKIARYEFPHDWPDAVTELITQLRTHGESGRDTVRLANAMIITLQVIKELASGRLQRTRKSLEQVSLELLQVLGTVYIKFFEGWVSKLRASDNNEGLLPHLQSSYAALKIIRRLLVAGFEHPHREKDIHHFWAILQSHQDIVWNLWSDIQQAESKSGAQDLIVHHLFQLSKIELEMARIHPASFVLLPGIMGLLSRSWNTINRFGTSLQATSVETLWSVKTGGDVDEDQSPLERLALKALLLLRACTRMVFNPVQTFKYQHPQDKEDRKVAVETIKSEVLTQDFVVGLMEVLVTQYFVLRPSDLRDWEAEPDEWEKREEEIADAWEFSVRSCSEKLFLDLVINFKELLVPRLLQVFYRYATVSNTDVLIKESLYSAVGIAAACLEDKLDFNNFLRKTLYQEVQMSQPGYNLIRRRAAILLGQWVPMQPELLDRNAIYQIFVFLLSKLDPYNDVVVRVTAGRQLRPVLEPFEFKFADFAPSAGLIFQRLMALIAETELSETKMALLETVRVGVTKMEDKIEPYADEIISMLPPLWTQSGEEHLMKQAILTMITAIITSLGQKSLKYHSAFVPLIRDAVQTGSETMVYLLEDALDLWAAILQQAPSSNPSPSGDLLSLVMCLIPLLDTGSDSLRQILELTESHTILSPTSMLTPNALSPLLTALGALIGTASSSRARDAALAPYAVEKLIECVSSTRMFPDTNVREQAIKQLMTGLVETGYLLKLLSTLRAAYDYHQDPRPSRRPPDIIGVGETSLFSILARLALNTPQLTLGAINISGNDADTARWVLSEWITHFDSIGDTQKKKLHCLAITNFLIASHPAPVFVAEQLQSLMTIWTDVITELSQDALETQEGDHLWQGREEAVDDAWPGETPEDTRKRELSREDPVFATNIRHFVAQRFEQAGLKDMGAESDWLSRIDGAVIQGFVELNLEFSS